jgi:signal transduction histidine kinase
MSGTKAEGAAEIHLMTSNFQPLTAEVTGGLVQYGAKPAVLCLLRDVTDRKDIEDMLIQSERDRAVCELAGATAHELNQPLTVIMGNVELFLDKIEGEDFFARYLHNIYNESLRLANLIKKIGNITRYKSKPYVGTTQIIDIDGASS